jgi:hypothetical protein
MIGREVNLTWRDDVRQYRPNIAAIVRIENQVRIATGRPDFGIADLLTRIDKDPVMFAIVWGTMLNDAGFDVPGGAKPQDAAEAWHQACWDTLTSGAVDKTVQRDIESARDTIIAMVAPSIDLGKSPAPRSSKSSAARK